MIVSCPSHEGCKDFVVQNIQFQVGRELDATRRHTEGFNSKPEVNSDLTIAIRTTKSRGSGDDSDTVLRDE